MDKSTMDRLAGLIGAPDAAGPRVDAVKVHVRSDAAFFHNPLLFRAPPSPRELKQETMQMPAKERAEVKQAKGD